VGDAHRNSARNRDAAKHARKACVATIARKLCAFDSARKLTNANSCVQTDQREQLRGTWQHEQPRATEGRTSLRAIRRRPVRVQDSARHRVFCAQNFDAPFARKLPAPPTRARKVPLARLRANCAMRVFARS